MLQRKILVPSKRKQQIDSQEQDNLYFESNYEAFEMEEITSMLAKRLKFENCEEALNDSLKFKRCCFSDEKFISFNSGLEIITQQSEMSQLPNEKNSSKQVNQLKCGEKRSIQLKNLNEFKHIQTGEVNYLEFIDFPDVNKKLKFKKKQFRNKITKKIHKF